MTHRSIIGERREAEEEIAHKIRCIDLRRVCGVGAGDVENFDELMVNLKEQVELALDVSLAIVDRRDAINWTRRVCIFWEEIAALPTIGEVERRARLRVANFFDDIARAEEKTINLDIEKGFYKCKNPQKYNF